MLTGRGYFINSRCHKSKASFHKRELALQNLNSPILSRNIYFYYFVMATIISICCLFWPIPLFLGASKVVGVFYVLVDLIL